MRQFLEFGILPADGETARSLAAQALNFTMVDNVLYYVDVGREDTDGQQCLGTSSIQSSRITTQGRWQDISLELDCMLHSADSGGGALCTRM